MIIAYTTFQSLHIRVKNIDPHAHLSNAIVKALEFNIFFLFELVENSLFDDLDEVGDSSFVCFNLSFEFLHVFVYFRRKNSYIVKYIILLFIRFFFGGHFRCLDRMVVVNDLFEMLWNLYYV